MALPCSFLLLLSQKKSGYWVYAADFLDETSHAGKSRHGEEIENPFAFDSELGDRIMTEVQSSHKGRGFVQWTPGQKNLPFGINCPSFTA